VKVGGLAQKSEPRSFVVRFLGLDPQEVGELVPVLVLSVEVAEARAKRARLDRFADCFLQTLARAVPRPGGKVRIDEDQHVGGELLLRRCVREPFERLGCFCVIATLPVEAREIATCARATRAGRLLVVCDRARHVAETFFRKVGRLGPRLGRRFGARIGLTYRNALPEVHEIDEKAELREQARELRNGCHGSAVGVVLAEQRAVDLHRPRRVAEMVRRDTRRFEAHAPRASLVEDPSRTVEHVANGALIVAIADGQPYELVECPPGRLGPSRRGVARWIAGERRHEARRSRLEDRLVHARGEGAILHAMRRRVPSPFHPEQAVFDPRRARLEREALGFVAYEASEIVPPRRRLEQIGERGEGVVSNSEPLSDAPPGRDGVVARRELFGVDPGDLDEVGPRLVRRRRLRTKDQRGHEVVPAFGGAEHRDQAIERLDLPRPLGDVGTPSANGSIRIADRAAGHARELGQRRATGAGLGGKRGDLLEHLAPVCGATRALE
jgi:hypothetical protein